MSRTISPPDTEAAIRFVHDLVAIESHSGNEATVATHIAQAGVELGYRSHIDHAGNVVLERGAPAGTGPTLMLLGHIDTVPGDIPVRIEDGVLHGRGSVDAKGPFAAFVMAGARAALPASARLVIVGAVGEETAASPGAHALLDRERPDACIIGEPSGWSGVTLGYKGHLRACVTLRRPNRHTAGEDGSAIDALLGWWHDRLEQLRDATPEARGAFERVQATVAGVTSSNDGMHEQVVMQCGFRLPPAFGPDALIRELQADAPDGLTIETAGAVGASRTDRSDPVVGALSAGIRANGARPRHVLKTGTADLNVVAPVWGCPIAAYGPGDSALDHTPEERLDLEEYERAIGVLVHAIERLTTADG